MKSFRRASSDGERPSRDEGCHEGIVPRTRLVLTDSSVLSAARTRLLPWRRIILPSAAPPLRLLHKLQVQSDADILTHHQPAGLERRVPGQPEVLAIDLRGRRQTNARVAPRILR